MADHWGPATNYPLSVHEMLARPPWGREGLLIVQYPVDQIDVRGEVVRALFEQGVAAEPMPLETMHKRVGAEDKLPVQGLVGAPTIQADSRLRTAYQALIKYLAREVLQFDVVF